MGLFNNTSNYGPDHSQPDTANQPNTSQTGVESAEMHPYQKEVAKKIVKLLLIGVLFNGVFSFVSSIYKETVENRISTFQESVVSPTLEDDLKNSVEKDLNNIPQ